MPKTKIISISVRTSGIFGNIVRYENDRNTQAKEAEIDCDGGIWFTSAESAQAECNRRNAKRKAEDKKKCAVT